METKGIKCDELLSALREREKELESIGFGITVARSSKELAVLAVERHGRPTVAVSDMQCGVIDTAGEQPVLRTKQHVWVMMQKQGSTVGLRWKGLESMKQAAYTAIEAIMEVADNNGLLSEMNLTYQELDKTPRGGYCCIELTADFSGGMLTGT